MLRMRAVLMVAGGVGVWVWGCGVCGCGVWVRAGQVYD